MKRGDIVRVSAPGSYGKPRPAVVIQSDKMPGDSVLVALSTGTLRDTPDYRLNVAPSADNGLLVPSQIQVDKILAIPRDKCSTPIGRLDDPAILTLTQMLSTVLGLAD